MNKILNLVAVRLKSKRLPGKALIDICGKPLLWHLMERVQRSNRVANTVICTSDLPGDDPIQEFAEKHQYTLYRGHPDDVLLRFIECADIYQAGHIVRITGDNPLTDPQIIDEMIVTHLKEQSEYTYTEDPPRGTRPEIFSVPALKKCHALAEDPGFSEYMTFYFKHYPDIFKTVKHHLADPGLKQPDYILTVDTPEDYDVIFKVYERFYLEDERFSLTDVISFLDENPSIPHGSRKKDTSDHSQINTKVRKPE